MTPGPVDQLVALIAQWLPLLVVAAAGVVGLTLPRKHQVRIALQAVVGLVLAVLLVKVAGGLHVDPRPFVVDPTVRPLFPHPADNGFPSDHTTFAVAAAATLLGVRRRTAVVLAVLGVVGGLARVLAHVHHLQDIAGGALLGLLAAGLGGLVVPRVMEYRLLRDLAARWGRSGGPARPAAAARR